MAAIVKSYANLAILFLVQGFLWAALVLFAINESSIAASIAIFSLKRRTPVTITQQTQIKNPSLLPLKNHELVLLIDKSRSMSKLDCFTNSLGQASDLSKPQERVLSRWQWCREQTIRFSQEIKDFMPEANGLQVILFANDYAVYHHVDTNQLGSIFAENEPARGTHITPALQYEFDQYFDNKARLGDKVTPLLIAIMSDGYPQDFTSLRASIVRATQLMTHANEISIVFVQVGQDPYASKLLGQLDNDLAYRNAKFDIVSIKSYAELNKIGISQALANIEQSNHNKMPFAAQ